MNKVLLARKVLRTIKPIPEDEFIEGRFTDCKGRCCVIGHLMRLGSKYPNDYTDKNCSDYYTIPHHPARGLILGGKSIVSINNHKTDDYPYDSVKKRVTTFLKDYIKTRGRE